MFVFYRNVSGMSVEIGKIIDDKKTYIAGAPRSRNTGQVLLFQPTSDAMTIKPRHYLSGEQFGSGFGYDIAVSDFDSDGYVYCTRANTLTYPQREYCRPTKLCMNLCLL